MNDFLFAVWCIDLDVIISPVGFQKRGNRGTKKILMVIKEEKGRGIG
jgi:hypothetical protein